MTGYSRVYNKATNDVIEAGDFNTEFQAVADAFSQSSGHKHDGTAAEGAYITTISGTSNNNAVEVDEGNNEIDFFVDVGSSKVQQVKIVDGAILPATDDDVDLGSASFEFKDLYIDGTANIDTLAASGTVTGTFSTGAATFTAEIIETTYTLAGLDLDPANGTVQSKTMASNTTFTESLSAGEFVTLHLIGGDVYSVTWPTITWMGGTAPTLTANDVVELWKIGSTLYGAYVGGYT